MTKIVIRLLFIIQHSLQWYIYTSLFDINPGFWWPCNIRLLFCLIFGFLSYFNLWLFKSYFVILRFILGEGYPFSPFVIYNKVFQKCESLDFLSIINLRWRKNLCFPIIFSRLAGRFVTRWAASIRWYQQKLAPFLKLRDWMQSM